MWDALAIGNRLTFVPVLHQKQTCRKKIEQFQDSFRQDFVAFVQLGHLGPCRISSNIFFFGRIRNSTPGRIPTQLVKRVAPFLLLVTSRYFLWGKHLVMAGKVEEANQSHLSFRGWQEGSLHIEVGFQKPFYTWTFQRVWF